MLKTGTVNVVIASCTVQVGLDSEVCGRTGGRDDW